jgi:hypothetical protein
VKPETLVQGLQSIIALHEREPQTLFALKNLVYNMLQTALNPMVECLDVNHNDRCTNPHCWKYGR